MLFIVVRIDSQIDCGTTDVLLYIKRKRKIIHEIFFIDLFLK